jgi:hypothetical protein
MLTNDEIQELKSAAMLCMSQDDYIRSIEAAVMAKVSLAGYSVTCNGDHVGNLFFNEQVAQRGCDRLDKAYPGYKRQAVAVYSIGETP